MMKCPNCNTDLSEQTTECPICQYPIDHTNANVEASEASLQWVPIYETGNPGLLSVIKSLLDGNNIRYYIRGEDTQHLLTFGIGFNPISRMAKVMVLKGDVEKAEEILSLLEEEEES